MSNLHNTDRAHAPLGKRGAFEGVARRHGRRRNPARTTPRSSLRTPTNQPRHSPQRWVEKSAALSKAQKHRTGTPWANPRSITVKGAHFGTARRSRRRDRATVPLLCRDCGSRRCAYSRPDPRQPASASGSRSHGEQPPSSAPTSLPVWTTSKSDAQSDVRRHLRIGVAEAQPNQAVRSSRGRRPSRSRFAIGPATARWPGDSVLTQIVRGGAMSSSVFGIRLVLRKWRDEYASGCFTPR